MRPPALLVALAVLAGTAGCSDSEGGTPRPEENATGTTSPTTSAETSLPPRPRSLPLDGVDPCEVITEQQRVAFGIDRPPLRDDDGLSSGPLKGAPSCDFNTSATSDSDWGFLIIASTEVGLTEYLAQLQDNPTRRIITVGGFPAAREEQRLGPGNESCYADVDVADGHLLHVQFGQVAAQGNKILPMETLCAKAVEVAEAALTTLQAQR